MKWLETWTLRILFFGLLYIGFLTYWQIEVISLEPQPYILHDTVVTQGSYIFYDFHYCKNVDVRADITYQLKGATAEIALPNTPPQEIDDYTLRLTDTCASTTKGVYIPKHTPPGEYILYEYVDYQPNPFQHVSYVFQTEPFIVTE
jgi:hypothetical protein